MDVVSAAEVSALLSVIAVDVALAGDNAVVVGMAAAGLPATLRTRAIVFGIAAATVLRIVFAGFTTQLLKIDGLMVLGGLLLLWVAWKLWAEMRDREITPDERDGAPGGATGREESRAKSLAQALSQIIVADVSMSLDNVLAVAGAAREHVCADHRPGLLGGPDGDGGEPGGTAAAPPPLDHLCRAGGDPL